MAKRDAEIKMRVAADEKAAWQDRAKVAEMTLTDLIRAAMGNATLVNRAPKKQQRAGRKADPVLLRNTGRIGSNLNQIARWANRYKSEAEATQVLLALLAIEKQLDRLIQGKSPPAGTEVDYVS